MAEETDVRKRIFFEDTEECPSIRHSGTFVVQHSDDTHELFADDDQDGNFGVFHHFTTIEKCTALTCVRLYKEYQEYMEKYGPKLILGDSGKPDFRALGKRLGDTLQEFSRNMAEFSKGMSEARQQEKAPDIGERVEQAGLDNELAEYQELISAIAGIIRGEGQASPAKRLAAIGSLIETFEQGG